MCTTQHKSVPSACAERLQSFLLGSFSKQMKMIIITVRSLGRQEHYFKHIIIAMFSV